MSETNAERIRKHFNSTGDVWPSDISFLIEQAERAQEFELNFKSLQHEWVSAVHENRRLRGALEFYADQEIYAKGYFQQTVLIDCGRTAHQALEQPK
ncbi:hypothetical protein [Sporosarcina sp. NPDC096371]|uniref:hypothetical protein n=1 Tax=Sporosarcina sp. NPDC096371 TaxID=3364530 RepID=UPI0037FA417A